MEDKRTISLQEKISCHKSLVIEELPRQELRITSVLEGSVGELPLLRMTMFDRQGSPSGGYEIKFIEIVVIEEKVGCRVGCH